MNDDTRPLFILGMGAQKCGTSWVYEYLARTPGVDFGGIKEYHIWDARQDAALFGEFRLNERLLLKHNKSPKFREFQIRYAMQKLEGYYGLHFQGLVQRSGARITGDITPSYSALNLKMLTRLKEEVEFNGFRIKVVFLMRDPVERIWSAVRMERRVFGNHIGDINTLPPELDQVAEKFAQPKTEIRTRYDQTIRTIEQVFAPEDVFYGLYEELFTPDVLHRLCRFLGISYRPEETGIRVNITERSAEMSPDLRDRIAAHYAPVYAFCADRFPQTRTLWASQPG